MDIDKVNNYCLKIRNEIKKGRFDAAFLSLESFMEELPTESILEIQLLSLSARYNIMKQKSNMGIIEDENERNRLIYSLIELLNEMKQIAIDTPKLVVNTEDWMESESSDEIYGDPNHFIVLFKVISDNLKKSTKAMPLENGCIIQVTTERRSPNGVWSVAEALSFVPNAKIVKDHIENYDDKTREVGYHLELNK